MSLNERWESWKAGAGVIYAECQNWLKMRKKRRSYILNYGQ